MNAKCLFFIFMYTTLGEPARRLQGSCYSEGGGEHHKQPADMGVVIEGVKVLNELPSFTLACALLIEMIYINLADPKPLDLTFEVFQNVLLLLDQHKMSQVAVMFECANMSSLCLKKCQN